LPSGSIWAILSLVLAVYESFLEFFSRFQVKKAPIA
jgi:hypothetical protein